MAGEPEEAGRDVHREFRKKLEARQRRKLRALREGDKSVFFGFGMFGLVGWSVAIPALLLTALGVWIDAHSESAYSWTLMLLLIGVLLGCLNAWFWVSKERSVIEEERKEAGREDGKSGERPRPRG